MQELLTYSVLEQFPLWRQASWCLDSICLILFYFNTGG